MLARCLLWKSHDWQGCRGSLFKFPPCPPTALHRGKPTHIPGSLHPVMRNSVFPELVPAGPLSSRGVEGSPNRLSDCPYTEAGDILCLNDRSLHLVCCSVSPQLLGLLFLSINLGDYSKGFVCVAALAQALHPPPALNLWGFSWTV